MENQGWKRWNSLPRSQSQDVAQLGPTFSDIKFNFINHNFKLTWGRIIVAEAAGGRWKRYLALVPSSQVDISDIVDFFFSSFEQLWGV